MILNMLKAKIHRATVTEANVNYVGSITIDKELMDAVGILPNEQVQVVDNNNGARLVTYAIEGKAGSGVICLNGAAALLVNPGDIVIIMAFAGMTEEEARNNKPKVILVDENNKIQKVLSEVAGDIV
jgi:aspartate 1-decarboxylase